MQQYQAFYLKQVKISCFSYFSNQNLMKYTRKGNAIILTASFILINFFGVYFKSTKLFNRFWYCFITIVKFTFCCSHLPELLLPSCNHIANRCNMAATTLQQSSHQSIRKQPENPYLTSLLFFKKQDEPIKPDFINCALIRKTFVLIRSLLLKRRQPTIWKQLKKRNGR